MQLAGPARGEQQHVLILVRKKEPVSSRTSQQHVIILVRNGEKAKGMLDGPRMSGVGGAPSSSGMLHRPFFVSATTHLREHIVLGRMSGPFPSCRG